MSDWENAILLQTFITYHTPKGYGEPIHKFDFVPSVQDDDYTAFKQAYEPFDSSKIDWQKTTHRKTVKIREE